MRRWPVFALALLLAGCSPSAERPEGIVERWIVSMNQGPAGEPWRWAYDGATIAVSPTWDTDEPGAIDSFALGSARPEGDTFVVPFTIERVDGRVVSGDAVVVRSAPVDTPPGLFVVEVRLGTPSGNTGRWRGGVNAGAWPVAAAIGAVLSALAAAAVRQVRRASEVRT